MKADVVLSIAIIAVTTIDHFADSHNHMFMTAVRWSSKEVALPGRKTVKKGTQDIFMVMIMAMNNSLNVSKTHQDYRIIAHN